MKDFKQFISESAQKERVGNWSFSVNARGEVDLMNMAKLKNAIHVYKNKGIGDEKFYIAHNNQAVNTKGMDWSYLKSFIDSKYKAKDALPVDLWNKFYDAVTQLN
jgi:hypothetical protein